MSTPTYLFDLIDLMALSTSSTNKGTKAELGRSSFLGFVLGDLFCSHAKECRVGFPICIKAFNSVNQIHKVLAETFSFKMNPEGIQIKAVSSKDLLC